MPDEAAQGDFVKSPATVTVKFRRRHQPVGTGFLDALRSHGAIGRKYPVGFSDRTVSGSGHRDDLVGVTIAIGIDSIAAGQAVCMPLFRRLRQKIAGSAAIGNGPRFCAGGRYRRKVRHRAVKYAVAIHVFANATR
ncbi:hypothetical protein D3C87_1438950 [compost metagenome]